MDYNAAVAFFLELEPAIPARLAHELASAEPHLGRLVARVRRRRASVRQRKPARRVRSLHLSNMRNVLN